ncbi:replication initiation factor domain-containing protein [Rugamonas fusca]|uniref:replication initiation factor domain-containing protein n=1 Tax=Rugamonas fusca TaxID=2758568 RepID=UPI0035CD3934
MRPSISRIDLAHDDFDGSYLSVDWAETQWESGGFTFAKGGRPPEVQNLGNWKKPNGKGRTLTVGVRSSSKFVRFYEKGRKEGDKESGWCRCEIEFKNANTVISPDVLLNPSEFFLGAYPCMDQFKRFGAIDAGSRFEVKRRAAVINHDAAEKWLREFHKANNRDATGRIFKSSVGAFRMAVKESGIELLPGQLTHVLRHTFASHFMMNGGNILALQKVLGHSSLQTTMIYAHLSPDHLQEAKLLNPLTRLTVG